MKRRPVLLLALTLVILMHPDRAWANIYVPSLVDMISSPLMWSIYVVTMVITVPVILAIGYIETLAVRKHITGPFLRAFLQISLLNAITSLIRMPFMGPSAVWPGLPVSFILTIPAEALLVWLCLGKYLPVKGIRSALTLSARMNIASYAVLSLVVLGLVYIPVIGYDHPEVIHKASGRIVLDIHNKGQVLDVTRRTLVVTDGWPSWLLSGYIKCTAPGGNGTVVAVVQPDAYPGSDQPYGVTIAALSTERNRWHAQKLGSVPAVRDIAAVSGDGGLLVCSQGDHTWAIYNRVNHKSTDLPKLFHDLGRAAFSSNSRFLILSRTIEHQEGAMSTYSSATYIMDLRSKALVSLGDVGLPVFSPDGSKVAWAEDRCVIICDWKVDKRRRIKIRGDIDGNVAWSPDGKLMAYVGTANAVASSRWWRDIRVVDVESGASTTLYRNMFTAGRPYQPMWLD